MRNAVLTLILLLLAACEVEAHVRTIVPRPDQIIEVHTALGIATMIQTTLPILPAISGDQSGFRVEYLDKSTIIKPLRPGAKTNLFLLTDKQRYNLRLSTGPEANSDYVIYLKDKPSRSEIRWRLVNREVANNGGRLKLLRVGLTTGGTLVFEMRLQSFSDTSIKADDFWLIEKSQSKVIDDLYVSDLNLKARKDVTVGLAVAKSDLQPRFPITLEFRGKDPLSIQIPASGAWN